MSFFFFDQESMSYFLPFTAIVGVWCNEDLLIKCVIPVLILDYISLATHSFIEKFLNFMLDLLDVFMLYSCQICSSAPNNKCNYSVY